MRNVIPYLVNLFSTIRVIFNEKHILFLCFFSLLAIHLSAQKNTIDSLKLLILQHPVKDSTRSNILREISGVYAHTEQDSALVYGEEALLIAQSLNDWNLMGLANVNLGFVNLIRRETKTAIGHYQSSLSIFEELRDTFWMCKSQIALMQSWGDLNHLDTALIHYQKAKQLLGKDNYADNNSMTTQMGIIHARQENYSVAKKYFKEALVLARSTNDPALIGNSAMNLGLVYDELGILDSSNIYLLESLAFFESLNSPRQLAMIHSNLGNYYIKVDSFSIALYHSKKAEKIFDKIKIPGRKIEVYKNLNKAYLELENYEAAIIYGQKAMDLIQSYDHTLLEEKRVLEQLILACEKNGDLELANQNMKKLLLVNDSLLMAKNKQQLAEVEAKFKSKEQQNQLILKETEIKRQRNLNLGIGFLALLILGFGLFAFYMAHQREITNRLLSEQSEQLKSLDKAKSRFFTNISHELRTPLQLILAPLEMALQKNKNNALAKDLDLARRNGHKLLTLVNEILDLSKLESGKLILYESPVSLEHFLKRILFSYHSLAQIRGFFLEFEYFAKEGIWVLLDKDKTEKIINNLLSNAFKYSEIKGTITMSINMNEKHLLVVIKDEGKGINPTELEKIFDRFYQGEGESEPLQGGTGVGLAFAREMARFHGGNLHVESQLGKGSTFLLTLPLKEAKIMANDLNKPEWSIDPIGIRSIKEGTAGYTPILLNGQKPKLLVVEDNPEMIQFLKDILSPYYQCTLALDGLKALELAKSESFDLITSDVMMPNMDGFTFLQKIKSNSVNQQTPFILLTARALNDDKLRGLRLGVDDYITKPFQTNELMARIVNLLENKKQRDAWLKERVVNETSEKSENLSYEEQLLVQIEELVINNISNSKYNVEQLCTDLNYSRRQTERLIKKMTGLSPLTLIREIRLLKAEQYLLSRQFSTISEVAYEVGFDDPSYFTKMFTKRFGKKPSEVQQIVI